MKLKLYCLSMIASLATLASGNESVTIAPANGPDLNATEEVEYILLKPSDKTSEVLKPEERNPYVNIATDASGESKTSNEENTIRERLEKLRVVGTTRGADGKLRVMLGDMVLEAGKLVPQLLPEQSIDLYVSSIQEDRIELQWMERKPSGMPPRNLTIPVDLRPYVRFVLHGQLKAKEADKEGQNQVSESNLGRVFPQPEAAKDGSLGSAKPVQPAPSKTSSPTTTPPPSDATWNQAMSLLKQAAPEPPPANP